MASELRSDLNQEAVVDITASLDEIEDVLKYVTDLEDVIECSIGHKPLRPTLVKWLLGRLHNKLAESGRA